MFDGVPDDLQLNITSTIQYNPSSSTSSSTTVDAYENSVDDHSFAPLYHLPIGPADVSIPLNVFFDTYDNGVNHASFENITYNSPKTPTLFTALTMGDAAANPKAYGPSASVLSYGQVVELEVFNWDAGNHPL